MPKLVSGILALSFSTVWGSPLLSLPKVSIGPGSEISVAVSLVTEALPISALQFDLQYDPAAISFSIVPGEATRDPLKRIYTADVQRGTKRFLIVGLNQSTFRDGNVINLIMYINPQAPPSTYMLNVSRISAVDADGHSLVMSSGDGSVFVEGSLADAVPIGLGGVLNSASLIPGPVAPGEFLTLFGTGIAATGSDSDASLPLVLFDGRPSLVLYAKENRINVVAPFAIGQEAVTRMQLVRQGQKIADLFVPVGNAAPGLFTLDASGGGPGAILNQDSTINTPLNPANKGSVAVLYAAGSGQTSPPGVDGQVASAPLPRPALPVSVEVGGIAAPVLYAGAAPGFLLGLLQVNFRIPMESASGYSVPVILKVGTASSQRGVTIAVR
jgi:uncharacterized protein (TIGR03437 family)